MSSWQVLAAPAIGWFLAQGLKYILSFRKDGLQLSDFYTSGGFPSSHTTSAVALASYIGASDGWTSHIFALATLFAAVVMYDAVGVRRAVGQHSLMLRNLADQKKMDYHLKGLSTAFGHSPLEVVGGFVLGVLIGLTLAFF